jgi:putative membrane protein
MLDTEFNALKARVHAIVRPQPSLFTYYLITSISLLCAAPLALVPLYFRYHTLWYRFTDEGVSMGYGILFRRELQLTYARMQDIHLSQNILERWLGIGTLTVQTAGSGEGGNLRIVGVEEVEAIRDYLYARMRGVRTEASPDTLLTEIRDSLNAAAAALAKRAG